MTICDRISSAVAAILAGSSLPGNPAVQEMVPSEANMEELCRVVVSSDQANLRTQLLPGLYDVQGEVVIARAIGTESDREEFRQLCDAVEEVIGAKYGMKTLIKNADSKLEIYSWNLIGQSNRNMEQAMIARFEWTAFAKHDPNNPTA